MAPSTRRTARQTTPDRPTRAGEATTRQRTEFFRDYDRDHGTKTLASISAPYHITDRTARNWLEKRRELGSPAYHHTRKLSKVLGRKSRVSKETVDMLLSPSRNPVREQRIEAQIKFHNIDISHRQLTRRILKEDPGAGVYKMAYIKSDFSEANVAARLKHGHTWSGRSVADTFQWWIFTDEAHFDPSAQRAGSVLRRRGGRLKPENIQKRGKKKGVTLHVAGWCNWWDMARELIFYHNEEEHIEQPEYPRKPRKTMYQSQKEYNELLQVWEAEKPQPVKVKPMGNSMTGKYYTEKILPHYIDAINTLRYRFDIRGKEHHFVLQEDNDRSHGHTLPYRSDTLQDRTKKAANIDTIEHPPISPDVNAQEAVWNILKGKVKMRVWETPQQYKRVIQEEYSLITLDQVRARILELPQRMYQLKEHPDKPIKSSLW